MTTNAQAPGPLLPHYRPRLVMTAMVTWYVIATLVMGFVITWIVDHLMWTGAIDYFRLDWWHFIVFVAIAGFFNLPALVLTGLLNKFMRNRAAGDETPVLK